IVKENTVIQINDFSGRIVKSINYTAEQGMNSFSIALDNFAKGAYLIQIKSDKINKQIPIIVQ
ncbi:MAG TPA: T9SS type A sorting domain-containing protein, partial [Bacteroidia bacterium]|nr:T9SS type A sorting domain-containing protein [Bacteroidia bacterium]